MAKRLRVNCEKCGSFLHKKEECNVIKEKTYIIYFIKRFLNEHWFLASFITLLITWTTFFWEYLINDFESWSLTFISVFTLSYFFVERMDS